MESLEESDYSQRLRAEVDMTPAAARRFAQDLFEAADRVDQMRERRAELEEMRGKPEYAKALELLAAKGWPV